MTDVKETAPVSEEAISEDVQTHTAVAEVVEEPAAPGAKTESELLLKSLQEEREKRRQLEAQLQAKTSTPIETEEVVSDEGRPLKQLIDQQAAELRGLKEEKELERVFNQFPDLKKQADEFKDFKSQYPETQIENVAKLFLIEKGLTLTPQRKGLEKPSGGTKTPTPSGVSASELENLRKNNFEKYLELIKKIDHNAIR